MSPKHFWGLNMADLKGRWAVILGASSGLGAATARECAKHGMNIIGLYLGRGQPSAETQAFAQALASEHDVATEFIRTNIASDERRAAAVTRIREVIAAHPTSHQAVHVLVHSVAFGALVPYLDPDRARALTRAQLEMTLDVMANSLVYWTQDLHQAGLLIRGSRVFAMSSAGSQQTVQHYGAVGAAKAALEAHCRQLAFELAPEGVAVNAIVAGVADTNALRKIPSQDKIVDSAMRRNPSHRLTTPEDVAVAIRALSDPELTWITGATIPVDGGEIFCM
jgi:enoyl-[acyl-carrier protein] reductase III